MYLRLTGMSHAKSCRAVPGGSSLNSLLSLANAKPVTPSGILLALLARPALNPCYACPVISLLLASPPSLPLVNPIFIFAKSSLLLANLSPLSARPLAVFHTSLGHAASWTESKYGGPCQLPIGPCQAILTTQPCQPDSGATLVYISASRCS